MLSWCIMDFFSCLKLFKHTVQSLTSLVGCRTWCPTDLQHLCCKALIKKIFFLNFMETDRSNECTQFQSCFCCVHQLSRYCWESGLILMGFHLLIMTTSEQKPPLDKDHLAKFNCQIPVKCVNHLQEKTTSL